MGASAALFGRSDSNSWESHEAADRFDYILIETTGMADPGPVAQTFFVDDEIREKMSLDGL